MDRQPGPRAGGGGQPGVVRPAPARRDEAVGAVGQRRPDEELEAAQLVAAERQRQQVLALDPDLGPTAERGPEARQRGRAATARRAAGTAGIGPDRASRAARARWYPARVPSERMAVRITPADRRTTVGQHPGMERSIAISTPTVGLGPALLVDRLDRARRQDPDPPPRRLRDVDLHPVRGRVVHLRADRRRARLRRGGRRLRLHPGRRDPRRGERVRRPSRWSSS